MENHICDKCRTNKKERDAIYIKNEHRRLEYKMAGFSMLFLMGVVALLIGLM